MVWTAIEFIAYPIVVTINQVVTGFGYAVLVSVGGVIVAFASVILVGYAVLVGVHKFIACIWRSVIVFVDGIAPQRALILRVEHSVSIAVVNASISISVPTPCLL